MKNLIFLMVSLAIIPIFLNGCRRPDSDVTLSPQYNFASFAGTVWKTKVKLGLAAKKHYTGKFDLNLLAPKHFDPTYPEYMEGGEMRFIAVVPEGACLRINRLMEDNGAWGGVSVTVTLDGGLYSNKLIYVDGLLLENNQFIFRGPTSSTNWSVNPDFLEPCRNRNDVTSKPSNPPLEVLKDYKSGYEKGYDNGKTRGLFVAQHSSSGIDFSHLLHPWQRNQEWRNRSVTIYGEDYVKAYESGYDKGFNEVREGRH